MLESMILGTVPKTERKQYSLAKSMLCLDWIKLPDVPLHQKNVTVFVGTGE